MNRSVEVRSIACLWGSKWPTCQAHDLKIVGSNLALALHVVDSKKAKETNPWLLLSALFESKRNTFHGIPSLA